MTTTAAVSKNRRRPVRKPVSANYEGEFTVSIPDVECAKCCGEICRDSFNCKNGCVNPGFHWVTELECEVTVEAHVTPGHAGKLWGAPEDCYEAEGAEVEILAATLEGHEIPVDFVAGEELEDRIAEEFGNGRCDYDY